MLSFTPCERHGAYALLTSGRDGTMMHYGKKASWLRQFGALGNVLLKKCDANF